MGVEQDWERRKVMQAQTGKAEVSGVKKASIGGGYVGVLDVLQGGKVPIWFGTYNIYSGRNRWSESFLSVISQTNMYLGIFQETKVTDGIYTCGSDVYSVVAMDAPS